MKYLLIMTMLVLAGCSESPPKDNRTPEELRAAIQAAMQSEDYATAEQALTSMIAKNPNDFEAVSARAGTRIFLGDADGAANDFDAAIKMDQEQGEKLKAFVADRSIWRARELDMKKRHPEALKIYDVLLALYPEAGMVYHDRGGLKTSMGDFDGAIADLTKAIEFDAGNNSAGDSYTLRARAKRAKGDEKGAVADDAKAKQVFEALQKGRGAMPAAP